MAGYGQFCAVARALDVLGERWTLLIARELLLGTTTFTGIRRGLPRIPPATLASRLRRLSSAGVVQATADGYQLTEAGAALAPVVRELARWATGNDRAALSGADLDTAALTWDIQRRINTAVLPARTVVLAIDFTDRTAADRYFWLHLSRADVQLCREDTGAPADVWLATPTEPATRWWLGYLSWAQLLTQPGVEVSGNHDLIHQMRHWFLRYLFTPQALEQTASR